MRISEIFYSIQGEGMLLGVPSVFVRTTGCNLRCRWCDTPYTSWHPEGSEQSLEQIVQDVSDYGSQHVVVTGGEPMLFAETVSLTGALAQLGKHITIETAGTVDQPVFCDLMSISPKLSNSTPLTEDGGRWAARHDQLRYQPAVLRTLMRRYQYQLKFVVTGPEDLNEIEQMVHDLQADRSRVLLMPEGRDANTLHQRSLSLAETCKQTGFRLAPRLHVDLWGDRRGV